MQTVEYLNPQSSETVHGEVTVSKAVSEDFDEVYPLLLEFNIPRISRENWRRLFNNNWNRPEDHRGYLLRDGREVKGFLGLLFSTRLIEGRVEKFCNMTSWIVKEDFRNQSLKLLLEVLKLKDYTVTNFTASKAVAVIVKKCGFTEIQTNQRILFPVPRVSLNRAGQSCIFALEEIRPRLEEKDRKIFDDHQNLDCRHVLISSGSNYCYLVMKNKAYKHLPFARIHYLSNRTLFLKSIDSIRTRLCWSLKVAGLMVDDRYLNGQSLNHSSRYPPQCSAFFKSGTLSENDIDTLYSEMILLHD